MALKSDGSRRFRLVLSELVFLSLRVSSSPYARRRSRRKRRRPSAQAHFIAFPPQTPSCLPRSPSDSHVSFRPRAHHGHARSSLGPRSSFPRSPSDPMLCFPIRFQADHLHESVQSFWASLTLSCPGGNVKSRWMLLLCSPFPQSEAGAQSYLSLVKTIT
jgi:hypothetical protein